MAGVFVRPELVIEPGWEQMEAAFLIFVATIGITFSLQAQFTDNAIADKTARLALAVLALIVLFSPSEKVALGFCLPVILAIGYWLVRRRIVLEACAAAAATQPVLAGASGVPVIDSDRGRVA